MVLHVLALTWCPHTFKPCMCSTLHAWMVFMKVEHGPAWAPCCMHGFGSGGADEMHVYVHTYSKICVPCVIWVPCCMHTYVCRVWYILFYINIYIIYNVLYNTCTESAHAPQQTCTVHTQRHVCTCSYVFLVDQEVYICERSELRGTVHQWSMQQIQILQHLSSFHFLLY